MSREKLSVRASYKAVNIKLILIYLSSMLSELIKKKNEDAEEVTEEQNRRHVRAGYITFDKMIDAMLIVYSLENTENGIVLNRINDQRQTFFNKSGVISN